MKDAGWGPTMFKMSYLIVSLILLSFLVLGYLMLTGPKQGLQTPPIEPKAMSYLEDNKLLEPDETLAAYKATGFYTYNQGAVITNKRLFVYSDGKQLSIPLDKISMVVIKDTHLGHQQVLISANTEGAITMEVYHSSVPQLLKLLNVSNAIVRNVAAQPVAEKL